MDAFTKLRLQKTAFGERLAQARMRLRLSQEDLAEAIGITARTVSRWERSNVIPQQYYLERLAEILLIPLDKLFGADEESQYTLCTQFVLHRA
jgi:transcriptional regulator with XRE-family HTH domain